MDKIPGPPTHFLLGNAILVLHLDRFNFVHGTYVLIYQMLTSITLLFDKERICKMWLGFKPFVILFTPEACEVVLSNNNLTIKADEYNFLKPWLGEGLVTSNYLKWKKRRKMLTPAFHLKILEDFLPVINEHCFTLIDKLNKVSLTKDDLKNKSDNNFDLQKRYIHDVVPIITLCTLDILCETSMGIKLNVQIKETNYINCLQEVEKLFLKRITRPWFWPDFIYQFTNDAKRFKNCLKIMRNFTLKVIENQKQNWINYLSKDENLISNKIENKNENDKFKNFFKNNHKRLAFLDLLLQQHLKDEKNFTIQDIREEVDTFMFAGHDTTALGISWTLYMLGRYQDVQNKVRQEIDEIFDKSFSYLDCKRKSHITLEQLKEMKYLDCVLKEVQRIYPTAPFFARKVTEEIEINGYTIPVDSTVAIFTYAMHRNPQFFVNPLKFDPDRFLPENSINRHPYAYIPFSAGSRNCIGQKFSQIEQKLIISKIVYNFFIEAIDPEDKLTIAGEMVLKSKTGLNLKFYKRFTDCDLDCLTCNPEFDLDKNTSQCL